jgi:hypothetical protein
MLIALVCKKMGWTWEDCEKAPAPFFDTVIEMLQAEAISDQTRQTMQAQQPNR